MNRDLPASTVDAEQPWLGLDSFTESTRGFFYGREEEVAELARRVQRKPLTVLFGQSGLGKTSILRAGLVPRLRPEGYCPVYVRIDYGRDAPIPAEQIKQAIFRETLSSGSWTQTGVAAQGESLWEFLHHRDDMLRDAAGRTLTPLLIFDQFEEIFTLAQSDDFGRARAAQFVEELADLVENRPPRALEARLDDDDSIVERFDFARCDYRILIALREDYLAHLEAFKATMPSITQNRMRIARMTGQQALDAVLKPGGRLVSQEVAEAIVRFVAGGAELRNAEVEPSLLSLICRELNAARIAQGRGEISADLLAGSHATILAEFYQRALADQPPGVHRFIEEELLTESGFRENIAQERVLKAFTEAAAAPDALARLVDRRLLRIEERLDVRRVELTHDVLCSVVKASRDTRHEREAREDAERQLAAQLERERAAKAALQRARSIAAGCAVLAVVAVAAAGFGIWGMRQAQQTQAMAEAARGESERLVVYLLDDFYRELEPLGRLDMVADLAKRAIDYYQGLPAALRTQETARNLALAQVRYAAALRTQGKLDEARTAVDAAVQTLDRLYTQADRSEPTVIGLALGLSTQSRIADSNERYTQSMAPALRAVEVIAPQAKAPDASIALRRVYANVLWRLGFTQTRQGQEESAIDTLESALAVLRGIDGLSLGDLDAATQFAEASAWLALAYLDLDRIDVARAVALEGRELATRILARRPTHYLALRARALLTDGLAQTHRQELRVGDAVSNYLAAAADWKSLAAVDPTNAISWNNLANARNVAAFSLRDAGRLREALAVLRENREVEPIASARTLPSPVLMYTYGTAAYVSAELGDPAQSRSQLAEMNRHGAAMAQRMGTGSFEHESFVAEYTLFNVEVAFALNDEALMQQKAAGLRERMERLSAANEGQERRKSYLLARLHRSMGRAALEGGHVPLALEHLRAVAPYRAKQPTLTMAARQDAAEEGVLLAAAAVRSGQAAEAREAVGPALRFLREAERRNTDDNSIRLLLLQALCVAASVDPVDARNLVREARAIAAALPPEMRQTRSSRWWIDRLNELRPGAKG